jgi:hypothetical protein
MALRLICFDAQPSVRNVDYVALLGQPPSASGEIVAFVLAGMLFQYSGARTGDHQRIPTVVVLLTVMNVRPGKNHR